MEKIKVEEDKYKLSVDDKFLVLDNSNIFFCISCIYQY